VIGAKLNDVLFTAIFQIRFSPATSGCACDAKVADIPFWGHIMTSRTRGFRALVLGAFVAAGLALAPTAFAHGGIGIGINLPGLSIGVGPHHHGYVGIGGGYYSGYAPAYYAPAPVVYDYDDYYSAPVYVGGYYGGGYNRYQYHYYRGGGYYHGYHGGYHHDYHHGGYYHDGGYSHSGYHHR